MHCTTVMAHHSRLLHKHMPCIHAFARSLCSQHECHVVLATGCGCGLLTCGCAPLRAAQVVLDGEVGRLLPAACCLLVCDSLACQPGCLFSAHSRGCNTSCPCTFEAWPQPRVCTPPRRMRPLLMLCSSSRRHTVTCACHAAGNRLPVLSLPSCLASRMLAAAAAAAG